MTVWEQQLRQLAGQQRYSGDFVANLVHDWLFYTAPPWVFTVAYSLFGLLVAISFLVAPPQLPGVVEKPANRALTE